jgi:hypothetical protein
MIKNLLLPLGCLLVGGAAGYGLRGVSEVSDQQSPQTAAAKSPKADGKSSDSTKSASSKEDGASSSDTSLADQMKELLADFDSRSALKAAKKLSATEIQSALVIVAAMPKSQDRDGLISSLYSAWAAIDPTAAWKAALTDPTDKNSGRLLRVVAGVLAKTNPKAAIDLAMSLGMGGKRSTVMTSVFSEWAKVDVAAAIAYSETHPEHPTESYLFGDGLNRLAEKDPLKAANLAIAFKDKYKRSAMLMGLMNTWVERDPTAALKWAQSQTNPQLREDATAAAVGAWAKNDPKAALSYVQSIADVETRASAFKKAWGDWFKNDPDAATTYVASIKDEKLLENLSFQFGYNTEGLSPKEKASLLARLPEGKLKQDIYRTMTDTQIRKGQFNDALAMLNLMPDSRERDRNVAQLGQTWAKADLAAATAWLKMQPDSTDRDLALSGYVSTLARTDPLSAINWAKGIPDEKLRQGAMVNIASSWLRADPTKAQAWINGAGSFSKTEKMMIESYAKFSSDYLFNTPTVGTRR